MGYNIGGRITRNFALYEVVNARAQETEKLILSPEIIEHAQMMQQLRDWYGKPLTVNSWYRTKTYNQACGGNKNSEHLDGRATDVAGIPASLYHDFTVAWNAICSAHGKIANVGYYTWGMHFGSNADRYGYKQHYQHDYR